MKKYFNYAFLGAIVLLGSSVFTACSSESGMDSVDNNTNPTYDPEAKTVTAQFVLNVSSATGGITRQSATTVQKAANFRGMQDAKLIGLVSGKASSFLAPYAGETTQIDWTTGTNMKSKVYDLGTLYSPTAVDNDPETDNKDNSSHRVVELTLPINTDAMLVYGRAIPTGTDEANGKVTMPTSYAAPENITFSLVSRLGDENYDKYTHTCNLLALILNRIMLSEVAVYPYDSTNPYKTPRTKSDDDAYAQTEELPALSWRELGAATGTLAPLQENLSKLFKAITSYSSVGGENAVIRSGSSAAILDMMKDAYAIVISVYHATPTTQAELNAQRLAFEILTRMDYYFTPDAGTISALRSVTPTTTSGTIGYALIHHNVMTESDFSSQFGDVTTVTGLPTAFHLPEGVSQLFYTAYSSTTGAATGGFSYQNPSQSLIDISNTLNPKKYTYPSELLYFDNSLLRVNDAEVAAADYPNGYTPWDTDGNWTAWTTGKVTSTTRSVAVKNNINYGVSMLQTSVVLKDGVSAFQDNRTAVTGESAQTLTVGEVSGFTLTGVLIGGQYKKLGWNYLAKEGASDNTNFVIYDNQIANDGKIPTTVNKENYTLVFDNCVSTGDQQDVLVALEFQNANEKDFYGKGGIIPKGSKFYLVGKLKLDDGEGTITWPTTYAIPPYTVAGASTQTKRVFIQDYTTTVTFTIDAESLKNAYSTVPDLRASQISLGLSVDLNWRPGLNFSVNL